MTARRPEPSHPDAEFCGVCLLDERAVTHRDKLFYSCDGDGISFGELRRRARSIASGLARAGVGPGDVITTLSHNSVAHLAVSHACARVGAVWTPLNISFERDDLAYSIEQVGSRVLLATSELLEPRAEFVRWCQGKVESFTIDEADPAVEGTRWLEPAAEEGSPDHHWSASEWAYVIGSGATTGRPKAIGLPHAYAAMTAERIVEVAELTEDDVYLSVLQMAHAWQNFAVLAPALSVGATVMTTRWFSASRWIDQVHAAKATIVDPFLPMATALLAQRPRPEDRTHNVRVAVAAVGTEAEADRRLQFEERFGVPTVNVYGLTEAGALVANETLTDRRLGSSGRINAHYEATLDVGGRWTNEPDVVGELLVRPRLPNCMALGYVGDAEKTLATWQNLWVHTGDQARFDTDGYLFFVGRLGFWIRRKAENISAGEVEEAILGVEGVLEAGVFGVPSALGDEDVAAALVVDEGSNLTPESVHRLLAGRIASFKVPQYIRFLDDIPRTLKNEVNRKRLLESFEAATYWDAAAAQPPL